MYTCKYIYIYIHIYICINISLYIYKNVYSYAYRVHIYEPYTLQVEALMAALDARAVVGLYIYTFINHFVY
jgi:hypothetical protein